MGKWLTRCTEFAYFLLRVGVAVLFFFHGAQKLAGAFGGAAVPLISLRGAAGVIEAVIPPFIALGLFTSWAAVVGTAEMSTAYYLSHHPRPGWPIQNGGELSLLYAVVFLFMLCRGGGAYSLDRLFRKKP